MTTKKTTKPDRIEVIKKAAETHSHLVKKIEDSPYGELTQHVVDLSVERDALAARVLELEKVPASAPSVGLGTEPHGVLFGEMRAFLAECLRTGTFNSTTANGLLKR